MNDILAIFKSMYYITDTHIFISHSIPHKMIPA